MAATREVDANATAGMTTRRLRALRIRVMRLCIVVKPPCEDRLELLTPRCTSGLDVARRPTRGFCSPPPFAFGSCWTCEKLLLIRAKEPRCVSQVRPFRRPEKVLVHVRPERYSTPPARSSVKRELIDRAFSCRLGLYQPMNCGLRSLSNNGLPGSSEAIATRPRQ